MPPCEAWTTPAPCAAASSTRVMLSATTIGAAEGGIGGLARELEGDCFVAALLATTTCFASLRAQRSNLPRAGPPTEPIPSSRRRPGPTVRGQERRKGGSRPSPGRRIGRRSPELTGCAHRERL